MVGAVSTTDRDDRRSVVAAMDSQRDDLRALAARYRLGAALNDLDELGKAVGPTSMPTSALLAGRYLALLLDGLDDGSQDREWRARTYGAGQ